MGIYGCVCSEFPARNRRSRTVFVHLKQRITEKRTWPALHSCPGTRRAPGNTQWLEASTVFTECLAPRGLCANLRKWGILDELWEVEEDPNKNVKSCHHFMFTEKMLNTELKIKWTKHLNIRKRLQMLHRQLMDHLGGACSRMTVTFSLGFKVITNDSYNDIIIWEAK